MKSGAEIPSDDRDSSAEARPAVAVEDVSFTYHGGERPALRGVRFELAAGQMIGVMGASGAGKSTLAKCLNYLIPGFEDGDFRGLVRIGSRPLADTRVCDVAPLVGMVFQDFEAQLFSTNVAHEVAFAMEQIGMERAEMAARIDAALEAVGLAGFERRDPTSLSGGEKQRLAIASVMALRPSVIVLDEPTTDLDPEGKAEVFALIRRLRDQGVNLVVIEHEAEELRECDRILILNEGEIIADEPPDRLMTRLELLERCGIHPPDLNRLLTRIGIPAHARSVDDAEAIIRKARGLHTEDVGSLRVPIERAYDEHTVAPPLVEIRGLTHVYTQGARALDRVDLTISSGEFLAIIGQNGSGKTTLAKHIVGLLQPTEGRILLGGRDRQRLGAAETAREVGYVFQNPDNQIFAATVEDEVAFGPRNFGLAPDEVERRCARVLQAVALDHARKRDPFLLGKGERQRLAVASVLALEPRLLILDEPTTGLDYRQQRRMMELVSELHRAGTAIVIITHTSWLVAEYADRALLMRSGKKLFDGPVRALFAEPELLARSSFRVPEITALGQRFGVTALSVEELANWFEAAR
ncbi:MAG: energy-coupling factor transporter ATPase [Candidatus Binataceae bacterium]